MRKVLLFFAALPVLNAHAFSLEYVCKGQGATLTYNKGAQDQSSLTVARHENRNLHVIMFEEALKQKGFELTAMVNDADYGPRIYVQLEHPSETQEVGQTYLFETVLRLEKSGSSTEDIIVVCTLKKT